MNNENQIYILESISDRIEHQEGFDEDKNLLSNTIDGTLYYNHLYNDIENALTKGLQNNYIWGVFSKFVGHTYITLYDDEEYLEKYPGGIYLPGSLLIPLPLFKKIIENEPKNGDYADTINSSFIFLSQIFIKVIENKYGIIFSEKEYKSIYEDILNNIDQHIGRNTYKNILDKLIDINNLENSINFIKHEDFIRDLKRKGFNERSVDFFEYNKDNNSDYIDELLFFSKEVSNPSHPFFKLKEKVNTVISSFSEEEKQQLIDSEYFRKKYSNLGLMYKDSLKTANFLKELSDKKIKEQISTKGDIVEGLNENFIPLMVELSDTHFIMALNDTIDTFSQNNFSGTTLVQPFLIKMSQNENFTNYKRELAINNISGASIFNFGIRRNYEVFSEEEEKIRKEFFSLCEKGSLDDIKYFFQNNSIDPRIKNDHAITLLFKRGSTDLIDYLLYSKDLKKNASITKSVISNLQKGDFNEDVFIYLSKDKNFKEKLIDENVYENFLIGLCKKNSKNPEKDLEINELIKDLINLPGTEDFTKNKTSVVLELAKNKSQKIPLIKYILNKIEPELNENFNETILSIMANAFDNKNMDIVNHFIFDLDYQITRYKEEFFKEYPDIEHIFKVREVNKQFNELNNELKDEKNPKSIKKHKV